MSGLSYALSMAHRRREKSQHFDYKITSFGTHINVDLRAASDAGALRQTRTVCRQMGKDYDMVTVERKNRDHSWTVVKREK